jgi:protein TonB
MSRHLSSRQISACLIGAGDRFAHRHARECAACRSEIEALAKPLAVFRDSIRHWSEQEMNNTFENAPALLLTSESLDRAWYTSLIAEIRESIHPRELPPLRLTSRPVEVPGIWGFFGGHGKTAGAYSILIHCAAVAFLLALGSVKPVQRLVRETATLIAPRLKAYVPKPETAHGGGGGGTRSPLEASAGKLPKIAPRQFTPPRADQLENPKLPMPPTIVSDLEPPNINLPYDGDPLSHLVIPSNGPGFDGGIGTGTGGGDGPGNGLGAGPGSHGGFNGGAYRVGGGVSSPTVVFKVEPEYSEDARKAKFQGTVLLQLVVDEKGMPRDIRVSRPLGLGLDQKAIEAVAKWRFKPGLRDGKPVPVIAMIEVNFRLL